MSRRLSLLLVLAMLLGLAAGCGQNNPEPAMAGAGAFGTDIDEISAISAQEETAEAAATSSIGSFSMPYNASYGWNPFTCIGMENRAVMQLVYESLFVLNNAFDAEPLLCKEYSVTDDGYVYTLELQTANFTNGKEMTADDVVYSIARAKESPLYSGRLIDISSYYSSGPSTVIIEMRRPNDRLPCLLTFPIVPSYSNLDAFPAGTGPFVHNNNLLTVNNDWWQGANNLQFQTVNLYSSSSAEDTRDFFEIDAVHLIYNNPNSSTAASYHSDYELWNSRGTTMQYLAFNANHGIFSDSAARVAVSHAIDRVSIAESVYRNFADAAVLPASPYSSVYDEDLAQKYAYTSVRAAQKELLDTMYFYLPAELTIDGVSAAAAEEIVVPEEDAEEDAEGDAEDAETNEDGEDEEEGSHYNSITMIVRAGNLKRTAAAKQVAENLNAVGFYVTVEELDYDDANFNYILNVGDWDLFYGEVTLQPDFDLRPLLASGGSLSYGGLGGAGELDSLLASARENTGNYYDLFASVMENGYLCPVLFLNNAVFTTRGMFTGLNPTPDCLFYQITNIQVHE